MSRPRVAAVAVVVAAAVLALSACADDDETVVADGDRPVTTEPSDETTTTAPSTTTSVPTAPRPPGRETVNPRPHAFHEAEVLPPGDVVRLTYWTGVCDLVDHATVETSPEEVTITLYVGRDPEAGPVCIELAKEAMVDVPIGEPVGDRRIVDGAASG